MSSLGFLRRVDLVGLPAVRLELRGFAGIGVAAVEDLARRIGADGGAIGAEQLVERHAGRLGGDVPQRRIAGPDHAQAGDALARAHGGVQVSMCAGILAHQDRLEEFDQCAGIGLGGIGGRAEERQSLDASVRADTQQTQVAAARDVVRALRVFGRRNVVPGEQGQLDGIDLHETDSRKLMSSRNFAERSIRDPGSQTLCVERVVPGSRISRCAQFRDDRSSIPQQRGDALDRLADVIDGVGVGEADVAFAVDAEAGAGDGGDAGRFQHLVL